MVSDTKIVRFKSEDAINEVFIELAVHPDKWYDLALFAQGYGFLTKGKARLGEAVISQNQRSMLYQSL